MKRKKDSGVEWIEQIPEDWRIERLQWYLDEVKVSNSPLQTSSVLSLTNKLGVIPYEEKGSQGNTSKEDYTQYKLAYPNTIVANSMNILIGSVGICNYFGCVSPVYYVFMPKATADLQFINYIFQTKQFQQELRRYANGILEIRLRVSANGILKRMIAIPTLEQQKKIVVILNRKIQSVDNLIANQQAQIEKLKEYKQAVITEAVTKGLDKTAPMKDSGVEWIGEIPIGWKISRKLKYHTIDNISYGIVKLFEPDNTNGVKVLRCSDILEGQIDTHNIRTVTQKVSKDYARTILKGGEVVVNVRGSLGGCSVVPHQMQGFNIAREVAMIRVSSNIDNRFLMYYFLSNSFVDYRTRFLAGSVYIGLNIELLSSMPLPIPPITEQHQIADYLDNKCADIDSLVSIKQQKIEELKEYKKSLIYEYVTGKKEVT